jgi:hypothetical protein
MRYPPILALAVLVSMAVPFASTGGPCYFYPPNVWYCY